MESNSCISSSNGQCGQRVKGKRDGISSSSCPLLKKSVQVQTIPNDVPVELTLQFEHLPKFYHNEHSFWCMVHIEEGKFKVSARMNWETLTVICDQTVYNYNANERQIDATVSVMVNQNNYILDSKTFSIYKCGVLGSYKNSQDCTLCMSKQKTHGCTWCSSPVSGEGKCVSEKSCQSKFSKCPGPEIFLIEPSKGPLEGGTILTIEGSNLGKSLKDLKNRIKIGNRDCELISLKNSISPTV